MTRIVPLPGRSLRAELPGGRVTYDSSEKAYCTSPFISDSRGLFLTKRVTRRADASLVATYISVKKLEKDLQLLA